MSTRTDIEEHGFAVLGGMFSPIAKQQLIADLSRSGLKRSKAGVRHAMSHEEIAGLAAEPRLLGVAQEILGREAAPFRATLFDKSPRANWLVVWHQDTALPLRERRATQGWVP